MGCKSCKDKQGSSKILDGLKNNSINEEKPKDIGFLIFNVTIRVILFVITLVTVPIIMLLVIYLLFKTIVLNRGSVNLMPPLLALAKKMGIGRKQSKEENFDDSEDLNGTSEDYEIVEKVDKIVL